MGNLNQLDASFLRMESERTPMHVAGLMIFKLPENAEPSYMRDLFEDFLSSPVTLYPFNSKLRKGFLKSLSWVKDKSIDMGHHVRRSSLPWPGGERELGVLVARLHSNPLDLSRPPWEFHVIEGLENDRFALYMKVHHSAIDGIGAMRLITRWLKSNPSRSQGIAPWSAEAYQSEKKKKQSDAPKTKGGFIGRNIEALRTQAKASSELTRALYQMSKPDENPEGGFASALETPKTRFNVHVTQQRRLATQLYDMERFKAIGKATGTTVNDVSLTILGSATQRYLRELETLPEESLVASVPLAVENPNQNGGNSVVGFVCPLATDESDVLKRLVTINAVTNRTKSQLQGLSREALKQFSLLGVAPVMLGQMSGLGAKIPPIFNFVVSNVMAPPEKLFLAGAELEALYPVSLLFDGYALNITIVGYADKISMGFVGCRSANPSLQRLAVYTGEALDELEQAVFRKEGDKPSFVERRIRGRRKDKIKAV